MLLNNFANYIKYFKKFFYFLSIITMEDQIEAAYITNTLTYLHLLPKNEQLNELNKILAYFKKKTRKYNKGIDYSPEYEKSLKRVVYLTFRNLSKY